MSRGRRWAASLALGLMAAPGPLAAQIEGAIDLGYSHAYVWRGLTRVTRPTIQPGVAIAWKTPRLMLSVGGWALLEPWQPDPDHLTQAGRDNALGELDAWVQGDYRLRFFSAVIDLHAGWIRYTFHADGDQGGLTDERDTDEAYVGLRLSGLREVYTLLGLPPDLPVGVAASAAFDLGPVGGTYLETALTAELPVLFIGEPLGSVRGRLSGGWSINQEVDPASGEPGRYDGEGSTHVALSLGTTPFFQPGGIPVTIDLLGTLQLGIDPATRVRGLGPDDEARVTARIDATASLLLPLRRTP